MEKPVGEWNRIEAICEGGNVTYFLNGVKVMEGRFGPYVSDGATHATLPKTADPKAMTLEEAVALIDAKAAKGPSKGRRKAPAKKKKKA